jgi:DNA ligase-1
MPNREFLMLAQTYDPKRHRIDGWMASEKLDGFRCLWDGGISRGLQKNEVPFANCDRDERYKEVQYATGLWSRYGNVIQAPEWFLDQLPPHPLDGELFAGRGKWQELSTIVKRLTPDDVAWGKVKYHVFDIPSYFALFQSGLINNPNFKKEFDQETLLTWAKFKTKAQMWYWNLKETFRRLDGLSNEVIVPVEQRPIESVDDYLTDVLHQGGEGLVLRDPRSYWEPKRSRTMLKVKLENDAEATVIGYTWGRQTDKGSKLLGRMGALVCSFRGLMFELSGFTDDERIMTPLEGADPDEGYNFPGQRTSNRWTNLSFPLGSTVTFKYRELSDGGIPKEARFWRRDVR